MLKEDSVEYQIFRGDWGSEDADGGPNEFLNKKLTPDLLVFNEEIWLDTLEESQQDFQYKMQCEKKRQHTLDNFVCSVCSCIFKDPVTSIQDKYTVCAGC